MRRIVQQRTFARGLNALAQVFNQAEGTVARIVNMYFTIRGALKTVPGGTQIQLFTGTENPLGPIWALFLSKTSWGVFAYAGLHRDLMDVPGAPSLAVCGFSGTLPAGTYSYRLTRRDVAGGETTLGSASTLTISGLPGDSCIVVTTPASSGQEYDVRVYGRTSGSEQLMATVSPGAQFTDNGSITPSGAPPGTNTAKILAVRAPSGIIRKLRSPFVQKVNPLPGSCSAGSTTVGPVTAANQTVNGGAISLNSPVPQVIPFGSKLLICYGNGVIPDVYDPVPQTRTPLSNTFSSSYPAWRAETAYQVGDIVEPSPVNGRIYQATQGGKTALAQPTFPATLGQVVSDFQVIWRNIAPNTSPIPAAAAHAAVFSGAMWLFNTWFENNANGLDGPSSLRMSDVGNLTSWNPLNQVFIAKDDGQEGMAIVPFGLAEPGVIPTGALIAFKEFSTYVIKGVLGGKDFQIEQAKTEKGCIAPRSAQFIPQLGGITRLTHQGVAVFKGPEDQIISDPVRPYLFDGLVPDIRGMDWDYAYFAKGAKLSNPEFYLLAIPVITDQTDANRGILKRILAFDTIQQIWTIIDLPFGIASMFQAIVPGSEPLTVSGEFNGGGPGGLGRLHRLFCSADSDWGAQGPVKWSFRPGEVFAGAMHQRLYVRQLLMRCLGLGVPTTAAFLINEQTTEDPNASPSPLTVTVINTHTSHGTRFEARAPLGRTVLNAAATISGTGPIEIDAVEWDVKEKPSRVPLRIG